MFAVNHFATNNNAIDLERLREGLAGTRFAAHLHHFASIDSTSTALLAAAAAGAPEGTVYIADEQTAGRGRGGHVWHSAPGDGLYLSALIRPALPLREALLLSLTTGLAAWQAVSELTALDIDIRWPNDLMLSGKKVGGILVETAVAPDATLRYAVIGIGINVHHANFPPQIAALATSLTLEASSNQRVLREALILALLASLDCELRLLATGPASHADLLARFAAHSTWVRGKRVHVAEAGGYTGTTDGLNAEGFLRVLDDAGGTRTMLSGGVREAEET